MCLFAKNAALPITPTPKLRAGGFCRFVWKPQRLSTSRIVSETGCRNPPWASLALTYYCFSDSVLASQTSPKIYHVSCRWWGYFHIPGPLNNRPSTKNRAYFAILSSLLSFIRIWNVGKKDNKVEIEPEGKNNLTSLTSSICVGGVGGLWDDVLLYLFIWNASVTSAEHVS